MAEFRQALNETVVIPRHPIAHFRALLFDAWDEWSSVTEFSLQFSAEEVVEIEKDVEGDDEYSQREAWRSVAGKGD
ncbi:uncharacterized protein PADG_12258 [Paracoccidioides brasiliensis Pb18]|uniref:Uncharacterized protein n=1 Tax=Paracoccidioides brasiliensis (strain Pb18) TaxID=502780 RepID=A0A0A0HUK1_PARBD|nr:uncharacterized protein PADG_12258 [Paracoccidioides brasiliensis Pb18]KGM91686.1 hypothetical protein PADG_12258 [Paracoccidioides brasiliensis Pb18]